MNLVPLINGRLDVERQLFLVEGERPQRVRELEAKLLAYLARHPERVISYGELLEEVWGYRPEHPPAVVHTTMRRLRRVIGDPARSPRHIFNVRGEGFRFVPAPDPTPPPAEGAAALSEPSADPLLGRAQAMEQLAASLSRVPLVSVVGTGGAGKTRLARELLDASVDAYPDGLYFVPLSTARNLLQVCAGVARALRVPLARQAPIEGLASTLGMRGRVLVVLDNIEQVAGDIRGAVSAWADALAEGGRLLLTSRVPLGIDGEHVFRLPPLHTPPPGASLEQIAASPSVKLYLRRARAIRPELVLTPDDARELAALVRELDGLPLAIELAAASARTRGPAEIRSRITALRRRRLDDTGPKRHTSLRAVLDWSWELLDEDQRAALSQCACFEGGFTLAAAEAVLRLPDPDAPVEDILDELIEHSVLSVRGQPARFTMLYAIQQLLQAHHPAPPAAWQRLAAHYARYSDREWIQGMRYGPEVAARAAAARAELGNLRAGFARARGEDAARCALALIALTSMEDYDVNGQNIDRALALEGLSAPTRAALLIRKVEQAHHVRDPDLGALLDEARRLVGQVGAPWMNIELLDSEATIARDHDPARALALLQQTLQLSEAHDMPLMATKARSAIAMVHKTSGALEPAAAQLRRALAQLQDIQAEPLAIAITLGKLGSVSSLLGQDDAARTYFQRALAMLQDLPDGASFYAGALLDYSQHVDTEQEQLALMLQAERAARTVADWRSISLALACQSMALQHLGRPVEAQHRARGAIRIAQKAGVRVTEGIAQYCLAGACWRLEQRDEAEARLREALAIAEQLGYRQMTAEILRVRADLLADSGEGEEAAALMEVAVAEYRQIGAKVQLAQALYVQGKALRAAGRDPAAAWDEAHRLAAAAAVRPGSLLGRLLAECGRSLASTEDAG